MLGFAFNLAAIIKIDDVKYRIRLHKQQHRAAFDRYMWAPSFPHTSKMPLKTKHTFSWSINIVAYSNCSIDYLQCWNWLDVCALWCAIDLKLQSNSNSRYSQWKKMNKWERDSHLRLNFLVIPTISRTYMVAVLVPVPVLAYAIVWFLFSYWISKYTCETIHPTVKVQYLLIIKTR